MMGDDSNAITLNGSGTSHGVVQDLIYSQVASKGTVVVNIQNADVAMYS
jgi:hypothetical protein